MTDAARTTRCDALLVHPVVIGALALWVVNDHVLKRVYANWWTGKLSDVAGMVVFPVFLAVALETLVPRVRVASPLRVLAIASVVTILAFALVKLTAAGAWAYQWGLGAAQWPLFAATSWATHGATPPLRAVKLAMDPTDLLAIPFVIVTFWLTHSTSQRARTEARGA